MRLEGRGHGAVVAQLREQAGGVVRVEHGLRSPLGLDGEALDVLQDLERARALQRDEGDVVALVEQLALEHRGAVAERLDDDVPVGRVRDDHEAVLARAVDDEVVDHAARALQEKGVLRAAGGDGRDVARQRVVEGVDRLGADDEDLGHVREVEEAGGSAHGVVLGEIAGVADRHLPPGEVGEGRAGGDVHLVQGRVAGFGAGRRGLGHEFSISSQCWTRAAFAAEHSSAVGTPLCRGA